MEPRTQQQTAFFLTGRSDGSNLQPMKRHYRPALFAHYSDLDALRYDFPLVLNRAGPPEDALVSLSGLVDQAVESIGEAPDRDRIARHGYRLERELRKEMHSSGGGDFSALWDAAVKRLAGEIGETFEDSANRLWSAFNTSGELVDTDAALPAKTVRHAWKAVQVSKAGAFRQRAGRLLLKLRDILAAEKVTSAKGRAPERLKSGFGRPFESAFDFEAMSQILVEAKPGFELSDERRERIGGLIDVLERQRFYPLGNPGPKPYSFEFDHCSEALDAYQQRHQEAVALAKTLAVAELETSGDYRESVHDPLFENFGAAGLEADQLAELPDYLVCTNGQELEPAEQVQVAEILAAGLPFKILIQTDDLLEPSAVAEGHVALGLPARQLVDAAIGLTDVFVFQSSASHLFRKRDSLLRGLEYDGPALFSLFSGKNGHTGDIPAYLVAAAAMESRVFPALVYDPSAGRGPAVRLRVDDNPQAENDWPVHDFSYEDAKLQELSEKLAFTLADFMAMDERFFPNFAIIPKPDRANNVIPVPEMLDADFNGIPEKVPVVTLVDNEHKLQRAILDNRILLASRRCRTMWQSLQNLGGIGYSRAEPLPAGTGAVPPAALPDQAVKTEVRPIAGPAPSAEGDLPEPVDEEIRGDDPYIETPRCTTCNECTELNGKLFAYDENKQAYIADPDAGTFRQLVEAAESCQVSIIHPGKPRNPKEPGLEDLIARAAEFN